jgi:hypothetical protein
MWDWIDLNVTALQGGLDGYNQSMQGMGDGQVFNIPTIMDTSRRRCLNPGSSQRL